MVDGTKYDAGKPRWSLVPWEAMSHVVRVLEFGARKYGAENWRGVDGARVRYWDAAMRHMTAYENDVTTPDSESGISHIAHAACCLLFVLAKDIEDEIAK